MVSYAKFVDVTDAFYLLMKFLREEGIREESRNGPVVRAPSPILICYTHPWSRVLQVPGRDANPFFHYMEAIWMLAGRDDVEWISYYNSRMRTYSDSGERLHGAYGRRWNTFDQLERVIELLKEHPDTRRAVVSLWFPTDAEFAFVSKDVPCNTTIYFEIDQKTDLLNITVCNRSNDAFWGLLGSNYVHFTMLQEYVAARIKRYPGKYYHFTNNLHYYPNVVDQYEIDWDRKYEPSQLALEWVPLFTGEETTQDFQEFCETGETKGYPSLEIAESMKWAYDKHKERDYPAAIAAASTIHQMPWRIACIDWLKRRERKWNE